jgi:hypothetical protein
LHHLTSLHLFAKNLTGFRLGMDAVHSIISGNPAPRDRRRGERRR